MRYLLAVRPSTCQHCNGEVTFGVTEHGYRGFVHTSNGLQACPPPEASDE